MTLLSLELASNGFAFAGERVAPSALAVAAMVGGPVGVAPIFARGIGRVVGHIRVAGAVARRGLLLLWLDGLARVAVAAGILIRVARESHVSRRLAARRLED